MGCCRVSGMALRSFSKVSCWYAWKAQVRGGGFGTYAGAARHDKGNSTPKVPQPQYLEASTPNPIMPWNSLYGNKSMGTKTPLQLLGL